jgi:ABC-type dipeptide/oligopeptide/nickel transport system permease subunit
MTILGLRPAAAAPVAVPAHWGRLLLRHRGFQVGAACAVLVAVVTLIGPLVTGDPDVPDYRDQLAAPGAAHLLGTDGAGRDVLARTVSAAGTSLGAALLVFTLTTVLGLAVGVLAGLAGGLVDTVLNRIVDVLLGLPALIITLAIVGALGPGFGNLVLAMSISGWAGLAKLARAHTLGSANRPDVVAARMAGAGTLRVAAGHILPGATTQVLIAATLNIGEIVLALAGLSFLGLGAQPPAAEWGAMLAESRESLAVAPWLLIGPGLGLVLTLSAATLASDALRDVTDPAGRR